MSYPRDLDDYDKDAFEAISKVDAQCRIHHEARLDQMCVECVKLALAAEYARGLRAGQDAAEDLIRNAEKTVASFVPMRAEFAPGDPVYALRAAIASYKSRMCLP